MGSGVWPRYRVCGSGLGYGGWGSIHLRFVLQTHVVFSKQGDARANVPDPTGHMPSAA